VKLLDSERIKVNVLYRFSFITEYNGSNLPFLIRLNSWRKRSKNSDGFVFYFSTLSSQFLKCSNVLNLHFHSNSKLQKNLNYTQTKLISGPLSFCMCLNIKDKST
jgi:hypothetical protein